MNRGEVVLVDFPFSDQSGSKVRPALVVLADTYNKKLGHTIVALITSSEARFVGDDSQLVVEPTDVDFRATGLRLKSVVQCENLMSVRKNLVVRSLGRFSDEMMIRIDKCLMSAFGLM